MLEDAGLKTLFNEHRHLCVRLILALVVINYWRLTKLFTLRGEVR